MPSSSRRTNVSLLNQISFLLNQQAFHFHHAFDNLLETALKAMMNPKASIVVTSFDREDSLRRLLECLNEQSVPPDQYEVIIADDSAELNTGEKACSNVQTRYRTRLVRTGLPYEVNGVSVARNRGIEAANGRVIISIDDDCIPNRYFVEEHLKYHKNGHPCIVLGHRSENMQKLEEDRPVSVTENKALSELVTGAADLLRFNNFMTGNISFPKDIVTEVGLFNEAFAQPGEHGWEDVELGYRLWRKGYPTLFSRNALVYRPATEKEKLTKRSEYNAIERARKRLTDLQPLILDIGRFLEELGRKHWEKAKELGEYVYRQDPENHGILTNLGNVYLHRGDIKNAKRLFENALSINSHHPVVFEKLGEISFCQKRFVEAFEYFSQSLNLDSNRTRTLYFMAHLKNQIPKSDNSIDILSRDINVELGGGMFPTKIRGEGQDDFINVDVMDWPAVDMRADLSNPLPFPDESVSRIFSRESIEHLPFRFLEKLIHECFRVMKHEGKLYFSCPDFEAIMNLYDKKCVCVNNGKADLNCPVCKGNALVSEGYWRSNLIGNQEDYGDGGMNDSHKNQITYKDLKTSLEKAGFEMIERDKSNRFYEEHKRIIKLSVRCMKP